MDISNNVNNINKQNIDYVQNLILEKQKSSPYFVPTTNVITDYDVFPYTRWYRGIASESRPIVAEREAGWRPRRDNCYKPPPNAISTKPRHLCFESACSTTFPCKPKDTLEFSNYLDPTIENSHVISYR
jgi:hypothetical protein